jgi:FtsP/CotA-like multicopper oxidase with cupredoxin domain
MKYKRLILPLLVVGIVAVIGANYLPATKAEEATQTKTVDLSNGDTYNLTASKVTKVFKGKEQTMFAYNGSIPAPTIRVKQGSEITINFKNNTDEPQLLHSHGVRMDNQYDGSQMVQKEIPAGGSFTYKLKFPDAGVYWYHPHIGEVKGQALGLYGAFIVEPSNPTYFPKVNEEQTLFLSDIPTVNGTINIDPKGSALMGHYGNVMLANGSENYVLNAKQGEVMRLYVLNSANVRPFNFTINGAKMKLVGGDSGAYEKASFVNSVLLAPSERAIVDVYFPNTGTYDLQNKTPNTTYTLGAVVVSNEKADTSYAQVFNQLETNQDTITSIDPFRKYFTQSPDKRLKLSIDMMGMGGMMGGGMGGMHGGMMSSSQNTNTDTVNLMGMRMNKEQAIEHCKGMPNMAGCDAILHPTGSNQVVRKDDGIEWEDTMQMMNQMSTVDTAKWKIVDQDTGKENMDIKWELTKDKPVVIEIFNDPNSMHPMQHPIHFHGQRFLVVSRNGVQQTNLVWKDTTLVRVGETVKIVLDPSNVGEWMAHCHISEHLASGMMFGFTVK